MRDIGGEEAGEVGCVQGSRVYRVQGCVQRKGVGSIGCKDACKGLGSIGCKVTTYRPEPPGHR